MRRFALWLTGWADIIDGVCIVITLGFWYPDLSLKAERFFLDVVEEQERKVKG